MRVSRRVQSANSLLLSDFPNESTTDRIAGTALGWRGVRLRIGVDATCWANARGYGRFTRELVTAMTRMAPDDDFICFIDERALAMFALAGPNVRPVVVPQQVSPTMAASADSARSIPDMLRLTRAVYREDPDVFFCPTVYTYFPLPPGQRAVITIHDAIAERFPTLTLPSARARRFWNAKVALAIWQSRLVLTVSEYAAREIAEVHAIPRARIRVALEAPADLYRQEPDPVSIATATARIGLPEGSRYLIYLGGFNPHKLVDVLIRAHAAANVGALSPIHLVLVGELESDVFHGAQQVIRDVIEASGTGRHVHWTGFVADADVRHLLAGAMALVLASASEGFGLPAVEAACCGTPVIATTESPLPELLAGGGLFVAPNDEAGLADAISTMAGDEAARQRMGLEAMRRARALTWDAGAVAALAALREAAA